MCLYNIIKIYYYNYTNNLSYPEAKHVQTMLPATPAVTFTCHSWYLGQLCSDTSRTCRWNPYPIWKEGKRFHWVDFQEVLSYLLQQKFINTLTTGSLILSLHYHYCSPYIRWCRRLGVNMKIKETKYFSCFNSKCRKINKNL